MAKQDDPKYSAVSVTLHESFTVRMARLCRAKGVTRTDWLREIIADALDRAEAEAA